MSLKILGGVAKGRSLFVPPGDTIRPTSVMMRRRLFDSRQDLTDYIFVDACAGSGPIGLEAWSRGAKRVCLVEHEKRVFKLLEKNYELFEKLEGFDERPIEISNNDCTRWLSAFSEEYARLPQNEKDNCIIFFDPPYHLHNLYKDIVGGVINSDWFSGELWIESDEKKGLPSSFWHDMGLKEKKIFTQGTSYVFIVPF